MLACRGCRWRRSRRLGCFRRCCFPKTVAVVAAGRRLRLPLGRHSLLLVMGDLLWQLVLTVRNLLLPAPLEVLLLAPPVPSSLLLPPPPLQLSLLPLPLQLCALRPPLLQPCVLLPPPLLDASALPPPRQLCAWPPPLPVAVSALPPLPLAACAPPPRASVALLALALAGVGFRDAGKL